MDTANTNLPPETFPEAAEASSANQRILAAARRLFALHGFKGTTTRSIARDAGVNEVTIFRIWGNKEALLNAVLSASLPQGLDAPLARLISREIQTISDLEAMLKDFFDVFYRRILPSVDDLMQIALKESGEHPEFLAFFANRAESLGNLLFDRLKVHEGSLLRPGCAAPAVMAILRGLIGHHLMARNGHVGNPDAADLVHLFLYGTALPTQMRT